MNYTPLQLARPVRLDTTVAVALFAAWAMGVGTSNLQGAVYSNTNWSNVGRVQNEGPLPLPGEEIRDVALDDSGNLYVGGIFSSCAGVPATNVVKWDGSSWSALDSGVNGDVATLLAVGQDLYVGGHFTQASGVPATNIAKWNGSQWSALGAGVGPTTVHSGYVSALAVLGGHLYVGGHFTNAGGVAANYVARWDGTNWSTLGPGLGSVVQTLAVSGSNLYAGGHFTTAGGLPANYLARWDGENWHALGAGVNAPVYSLAVMGTNLYAGGYFTTAGGLAATNIARWDGSSWSAVGAGIRSLDNRPHHQGNVTSLAVRGNDLYAAANYWFGEDWTEVNWVARWNGSTWSALGSEKYSSFVSSLVASSTDLYAAFSGEVFVSVAKARIGSRVRSVLPTGASAEIQFSGVTGYEYEVERATSLDSPDWATISPNPLSPAADGCFTFTDTNMPPGRAFYRSRLSAPAP